MYLPEWTNQHKEPRTEIKKINGRYYKYEVKYVYEKEKKRTVKKTVRLLGKLTEEEGFLPSEKDELRKLNEQAPVVDIKTFGLYFLYSTLLEKEIVTLKNTFDTDVAGALLSFSMMRWGYGTPIKRAGNYHSHDFVSEELFTNVLSDKCITRTLRNVGENREKVVEWMKGLLDELPEEGKNFVMMDSTHTQSLSENLNMNAVGYNPDFTFEKQVRLMYLFSSRMKQPVYYRMINGNITDVKSMALCVKEFGQNDVVYIADKGFYSKGNIEMLEKEKLQYIIPLRRNNPLIDFSILQQPEFKRKIKFFSYQNRTIWYYSYTKDDNLIITFLDEHLRVSEENDYLNRIKTHPEKYSIDSYYEKLSGFGTLSVVYKIVADEEKSKEKKKKKKPKEETEIPESQVIYETYKTRNEVEVMFDSYKNFLDADVAYRQDRHVMEGWLFANFIAMIAYYKLYIRLKQANKLSKYSPKDIIELSKAIYKLRCRGEWRISETTLKNDELFKKIGLDYLK
jgi:transposase